VNSLKAADRSCSVRVEHAALSWLEYPRYFIKQLNREAKHLGVIIPLMMLNAGSSVMWRLLPRLA